jgi:hypothetical protein
VSLDAELHAVAEALRLAYLGSVRIAANGPRIMDAVYMAIGDPRMAYQRSVLNVAQGILEQNRPRP